MNSRSSRLPFALAAVATLVYLALAYVHGRLLTFQINPDGVAYLQVARYYARGDLALAVNSYWGPMLSWLLVPAVRLGIDAGVAVKVLLAALGVVFALGVGAHGRRLGGPSVGVASYVAGLFFALPMILLGITPDLVLASAITWYLYLAWPLVRGGRARQGLAAGVVGGLAYLTKSYAMPFVIAHLAMTAAWRYVLARRGRAHTAGGPALFGALAGFLILAGPWVAIISIQDGAPTFGSSGKLIRAWDSASERAERDLPIYALHTPRPGRITGWENPMELPGQWPSWEGAGLADLAKREIKALVRSARKTVLYSSRVDAFSMVLVGSVLAVWLLVPLGRGRPEAAWAERVWLVLSVAIYMGGYAIAFVRDRYLWPIDGILIALATGAYATLAARRAGDALRARPVFGLLAAMLCVSMLLNYVELSEDLLDESGRQMQLAWLRDEAGALAPLPGPVASNRWSPGLYVAFWKDRRYLGSVRGESPDAIAAELRPFGAVTVVWFDAPDLAEQLDADGRFRKVYQTRHPATGLSVSAYGFRPGPAWGGERER